MKTGKINSKARRKLRSAPEDDGLPRVDCNLSTAESIESYGSAIRELLKYHKVPKKDWQKTLDGLDDWPKADADHDLHWFLGWFNGVAEGLGCNLEDLIKL